MATIPNIFSILIRLQPALTPEGRNVYSKRQDNRRRTPEGCNADLMRNPNAQKPTTLRPCKLRAFWHTTTINIVPLTGLGGGLQYDGYDPKYLFDFDSVAAGPNPGGA